MDSQRGPWLRLLMIVGAVLFVALVPIAAEAQQCEGDECGGDGGDEEDWDSWPEDPCGEIDPDNPCWGGGGSGASACYQSACMDCLTRKESPTMKLCTRVRWNKNCNCTDYPCTLKGGVCYYTVPT